MNMRNIRNAFSGKTLNLRSRARTTRRPTTSRASRRETSLTSANAQPAYDLRELAQRFMNMNQAHDRIRMQLLSSRTTK